MASLTEKRTLELLDKAEYLGKTIRTHKSPVSTELAGIYGVRPATGDGETSSKVDWDHVQDSNAELLDAAAREAREKGHAHRRNKVKASQLRNQRNGVVGDLKDRHNSLQLSIEATYGPDKLELVALDSALPRRFLGVREHCREITDRLRFPGLREASGDPRAGHSHLDFDQLAEGMEGDIGRFEVVYDELADMKKVLHLSMVAKDDANEHLNRMYTNIARMQEGMFRVAGLDELADRIRVTIPTRPRRGVDDPQPGESDQDGSAPDPASESDTETAP